MENTTALQQGFTLRRYTSFLRRQGWLIVLLPVLALAVVTAKDAATPKLYRASMSVLVYQAGGNYQPQVGSQGLSQTITNVLDTDVVAQHVISRLQLKHMTPSDLLAGLKVNVKPNSSVLDVNYDSHHKAKALAVLGGVAYEFRRLVQKQFSSKNSNVIVASVFDPPHLQSTPVSPRLKKDILYAFVLGLGLGLVFAFARDGLDDRIRGRRAAEESFGARVIASVPKRPQKRSNARQRLAFRDAIRLLSANVQLWSRDRKDAKTVVVTSADRNEGSAQLAASLASSLALSGEKVMCVEADLTRRELEACFEAEPGSGLTELASGDLQLHEALREVPVNGFMPSPNGSTGTNGHGHFDPARMLLLTGGDASGEETGLSSETVRELFTRLKAAAEYVVVDAPPLDDADLIPLALHADAVLVVAREGRTQRRSAEAVRDTLERLGADKVSVVLADARRSASDE